MTCDMWHVTHDTWHVTHDTWHVWGGWTFSQKFSSLALTVWFMVLWRSGGKGWLTQLINYIINDEAVYRTAQATPDLLIIYQLYFLKSESAEGQSGSDTVDLVFCCCYFPSLIDQLCSPTSLPNRKSYGVNILSKGFPPLIEGGGGLAGTVWFKLPACYHQNLGIFQEVWLF